MNSVHNVIIFFDDDDDEDDDVDDQRLAPTQKMARHDILQTHCTGALYIGWSSFLHLSDIWKGYWKMMLIKADMRKGSQHNSPRKRRFSRIGQKRSSSLLELRIGPE